MLKNSFYISPGSIFPVIQEKVHWICQRNMSRNFDALMDYVQCPPIFWSTRKLLENETADHGWDNIWGFCQTDRNRSRRGRNTGTIHKRINRKYWLQFSGKRRHLLRWLKIMPPWGHCGKNVGSVQYIFRPRVPIDLCSTSDISVRRIRIAMHESWTCQYRGDGRNATSASRSSHESGNSDGSRPASSNSVDQ